MSNTFRTILPVQVEMKATWADSWTTVPNVVPMNASIAAGGIGQFQFRLNYGTVKYHSESGFSAKDYTLTDRDWVRVKRAPYTDADILFLGRVESDSRRLFGPAAGYPEGVQVFTAYDGVQILNKRSISHSVSRSIYDDPEIQTIERLIGFNMNPATKLWSLNRSTSVRDSGGIEHYVFQKLGLYWSVRDAIEYIVAEFLNGSGDPAIDPQFTIVIPAGELNSLVEPMEMSQSTTALEMIRALIGKRYGWGWAVVPVATGWELRFFTLTGAPVVYESVTIPANPNVVSFNNGDPDSQIQIERTQVDTYGRLRVFGRPMVVCRSFSLADDEADEDWAGSDEDDYFAASAQYRQSGAFENVWQRYVADHLFGWDAERLPKIKADGTVDTTVIGPLPTLMQSTLDSLPIKTGNQFQKPAAYMRRVIGDADTYFDVSAETGCNVNALRGEIGLHLRVRDPGWLSNNIMAANPFFGSFLIPVLNYETLIMTVAFEAAERIELEYSIPGAKDSDGVFELFVDNCELWFVAKDTVIGLDENNHLIRKTAGEELRNDREVLYRAMAGLIARYATSRSRANVSSKGLFTYHLQLGHIFGAVADATDSSLIAAPITAVQWQFEGDYSTTVSTGYAI
jgi:hypothetical protein